MEGHAPFGPFLCAAERYRHAKLPAQLLEKVVNTLLETNGNKRQAAKRLGMSIGKLNRILAGQAA